VVCCWVGFNSKPGPRVNLNIIASDQLPLMSILFALKDGPR
ncbi:hypothetical protein PROFUN_09992, partial [Planoprotostelium fungivorum]